MTHIGISHLYLCYHLLTKKHQYNTLNSKVVRLSYEAIEILESYSDGSFSDCVFEMEDKIRKLTGLLKELGK